MIEMQMDYEWTEFGLIFFAIINSCTQIDAYANYPEPLCSYLVTA